MLRLLPIFLLLSGCIAKAPTKRLTILPIGDSITYGTSTTTGAWRLPLAELLHRNGVQLNYLGTQQSGPSIDDDGNPFDPDNEGHSANTIADINGLVNTFMPRSQNADFILFEIGVNTLRGEPNEPAKPADQAIVDMRELLLNVRMWDQFTTFLVSEVFVIDDADITMNILKVNADLPALCKLVQPCRVINDATLLDDSNKLDGLHPNAVGNMKLAEAFANELMKE